MVKTSLLLALAASSSMASPIAKRDLIGSLLSSLTANVNASLSAILSSLGITQATNSGSHGSTWNVAQNFSCPTVALSSVRNSHTFDFSVPSGFVNWTTFKANGVNLGAWLEQEQVLDPGFWNTYAPNATDEWTFCQTLGSQCGPVLEQRYATFINTTTIDKLASVGINTLRIPTTYAAWVKVPGSQLYHGNQQLYLYKIAQYAITTYNMHIIIGLHSLPGGVNDLNIGEAFGHDAWFFNSTNLDYSFQATAAILQFIQSTGHINSFTIAPINEASDNFPGFATAAGLTKNGSDWIVTYMNGVLAQIAKVDKRIPLMLQDCFLGEQYWSPLFPAGTNLVIDSHIYFFAASGIYSQYVAPAICGQSAYEAGDKKFPVFVGEFSLQTLYNNTYANRKTIYDTQRYAYAHYMSGSAFWTARMYSTDAVDGQGVQEAYWDFIGLIDAGVVTKNISSSYC